LNAVLMRHGRIWRGGSKWTLAHRQWIGAQVFDEPALNRMVATYRGGLAAREAELAAVEAELAAVCDRTRVHGLFRLIPSEYSSGARSRRGHITKAGAVGVRIALIEAA
jgi:transposase